jgi:hypothetical protein
LDFGSIIDVLMSTGYDGYVSGEFMPVPDAEVSAQKCIDTLRSLLGR